jgi:alkylhydroperoxidase family enzyme
MTDVVTLLRPLLPEATDALERAHDVATATVPDPAVFELCRARAAALLGHPATAVEPGIQPDEAKRSALPDWRRSETFTEKERAHLDFTEQSLTSVAALTDDQVDALLAHGSALDVHTFIAALYVTEFRMRLGLVASAVLGDEDREVPA